METVSSCPVCLEVPEQEIYQCSEGHTICHLCINKVSLCPTCKIPFGNTKIRCSRLLEDILETQNFACKFKNEGCKGFSKRREITSHSNLCWYNPNTTPLCEHMEYKGCRFKLGCVSKSQVISHFRNVHKFGFRPSSPFASTLTLSLSAIFYKKNLNRKRKKHSKLNISNVPLFGVLISQAESDTAPLFLVYGKLNIGTGFVSFICVRVWKSPTHISYLNTVKFTLIKDSGSSSLTSNTAEPSSSQSLTMTQTMPFSICTTMKICSVQEAASHFNPFLICTTMKICSAQEAASHCNVSPINIPISLLENSRFGTSTGDCFKVEISRES